MNPGAFGADLLSYICLGAFPAFLFDDIFESGDEHAGENNGDYNVGSGQAMNGPKDRIDVPTFGDNLVAAVAAEDGSSQAHQQENAKDFQRMLIEQILDPLLDGDELAAELVLGKNSVLLGDVVFAVLTSPADRTPVGDFQQGSALLIEEVAIDQSSGLVVLLHF